MSNGFDQDQGRRSVGPDLGPNYLLWLSGNALRRPQSNNHYEPYLYLTVYLPPYDFFRHIIVNPAFQKTYPHFKPYSIGQDDFCLEVEFWLGGCKILVVWTLDFGCVYVTIWDAWSLDFGCVYVTFWMFGRWILFGRTVVWLFGRCFLADVRFELCGRLILVQWTLDFGCMCNGFWLGGRWILVMWMFDLGWVDVRFWFCGLWLSGFGC